jgi:signal transduction histidine kinase
VTVRLRLTALYGGMFAALAALLLGVSYWLMRGHLGRTLSQADAAHALSSLAVQYLVALVGGTLVALALGWALAGRVLAPLSKITATARRVSRDRLGERIALTGPADELRELGDTMDGMLDRLADAFSAQERFVANASHELRSPLTEIRTEADVTLADPDASQADLRRMGEAVIAATDRTDALLESLMVLARSQSGALGRRPADLGPIASRALAGVGLEAAARGLRVRTALAPAPVHGDRSLLESLAGNLVGNAVRYADPGGEVVLTTGELGGMAHLRVANSGAEVSPARAERLVEPFERGGRHGDGAGAGLGLSIVRAVAEAHGGSLRVAPRPGGGFEAEVTLPRGESAAPAASIPRTRVGTRGSPAPDERTA